MKKKLVAGLLTGAMIAALLTGCAGSEATRAVMQKKVIRLELNSLQAWFLR